MSEQTREEVDAKIAASEACVDGKLARMDGKLDTILLKIDGFAESNKETRAVVREENKTTRANQWVIGVGLLALIAAIAALFPAFFGIGTSIKDMVDHAVDAKVK